MPPHKLFFYTKQILYVLSHVQKISTFIYHVLRLTRHCILEDQTTKTVARYTIIFTQEHTHYSLSSFSTAHQTLFLLKFT